MLLGKTLQDRYGSVSAHLFGRHYVLIYAVQD